MNKWLERALLSAGAALLSTTAIVTTAERPGRRKRSKAKGERESRGKDGALIDDEVPRSIGAQAAHDYREGVERSLTPEELLDNLKDAGESAKRKWSTFRGVLFGGGPPPGEPGETSPTGAPRARRRKRVRRLRRRGAGAPKQPAGREARPPPPGGIGASTPPLDEVKARTARVLAEEAAREAAAQVGLAGAAERLKASGGELWRKTEELGRVVKDRVPDDLGERVTEGLGQASRGLAEGARSLTEKVRDAMREDSVEEAPRSGASVPRAAEDPQAPERDKGPANVREEPMAQRLADFARWVEGPGAPTRQKTSHAGRSRRVRPVTDAPVVAAGEAATASSSPNLPSPTSPSSSETPSSEVSSTDPVGTEDAGS